MTLLGDYGGFNGAIVFLLSFLMTSYSANLYESAIAGELKYQQREKNTSQKHRKTNFNHLRAKLERQSSFRLDKDDLNLVSEALSNVKNLKASFWRALCHIKLCCVKDKEIKAMHKGIDKIDDCLDIRRIVDVRTNLNILLNLTLSA